MWKLRYMKAAEPSVSGLAKTNRRTSHLATALGGSEGTDEMKATWNETRIWLAMTHPSWSAARPVSPPAAGRRGRTPPLVMLENRSPGYGSFLPYPDTLQDRPPSFNSADALQAGR